MEFSKRPSAPGSSPSTESAPAAADATLSSSKYNPHHVVSPTTFSLQQALSISDVVISAVPSQSYKVPTAQLKDGCVCVNVAGEKNFESDVRDRAGIYVPSVGVMTIAMLQRNLLRLCDYQLAAKEAKVM